MGLGSVQVQAYILQGVVCAHGDGCNQTMYKWSVRTATENNKGTRTIGLPGEDNRMSVVSVARAGERPHKQSRPLRASRTSPRQICPGKGKIGSSER